MSWSNKFNLARWKGPSPAWDWVSRSRPGDVVYLVKERTIARVTSALKDGRIGINFGLGHQEWHVNPDGSGLDGKPLMDPYFRGMTLVEIQNLGLASRAANVVSFPVERDEEWGHVVNLLQEDAVSPVEVHGAEAGDVLWSMGGTSLLSREGVGVTSALFLEKTSHGVELRLLAEKSHGVTTKGWKRDISVSRSVADGNVALVLDVGREIALVVLGDELPTAPIPIPMNPFFDPIPNPFFDMEAQMDAEIFSSLMIPSLEEDKRAEASEE